MPVSTVTDKEWWKEHYKQVSSFADACKKLGGEYRYEQYVGDICKLQEVDIVDGLYKEQVEIIHTGNIIFIKKKTFKRDDTTKPWSYNEKEEIKLKDSDAQLWVDDIYESMRIHSNKAHIFINKYGFTVDIGD